MALNNVVVTVQQSLTKTGKRMFKVGKTKRKFSMMFYIKERMIAKSSVLYLVGELCKNYVCTYTTLNKSEIKYFY